MNNGLPPLNRTVSEMMRSARRQVIIVSAFVRSETLEKLFADIHSDVDIRVYARWRVSDIASGASDVGVIDVIDQRGADFRVHDALHAKIYIADDRALVGSANATGAGLGISQHNSNLEILLPCPSDCPEIKNVLGILQKKSRRPARLPEATLQCARRFAGIHEDAGSGDNWLPSASPKSVLLFSRGKNPDDERAVEDCYILGIGPETTKKRLGSIVRARRAFIILKEALAKDYHDELPDRRIAGILSDEFSIDLATADQKWRNLKEWIEEFSNDMYISPGANSQTVLRKGRKLHTINVLTD